MLISVQLIFSQTKLNILSSREQLKIPKEASLSGEIRLFNGHIRKDELTTARSILGAVSENADYYVFKPLVPLQANIPYTVFYGGILDYVTIKNSDATATFSIEAVYPSTTSLPENFLKYYIVFSHPVNATNIYDHIRILDTNGDIVNRAILPLENALLNEDGRQLTLWIEPGRQKRGLGPNVTLGPVFSYGKTYTLHIAHSLKNEHGNRLTKEFTKQFTIDSADRTKPNMQHWSLTVPAKGSSAALKVFFGEPMDFGSTQGRLSINQVNGIPVPGTWSFEANETVATFSPQGPWEAGDFFIIANTSIEDLAGNNLIRLFDNPISEKRKDDSKAVNKKAFKIN